MKINWRIRFKNPVWLSQVALAIFLPILSYFGLTAQDMTTWGVFFKTLGDALSNPYVLGLVATSVWSAVNDPTTGSLVSDSKQALTYDKPKEVK